MSKPTYHFRTMSSVTKAKKTRKRYSNEEKNEIIQFVATHDAQNGRGGKSAAVKKYAISPISLAAWIKASGNSASAGTKPAGKVASKAAKAIKASVSKGTLSDKLKELTGLAGQIDAAEARLAKLRDKFQALKASL
ncbi:MAG TPA: hypothetical protein VF258_00140 [Luteolibacter sp.]